MKIHEILKGNLNIDLECLNTFIKAYENRGSYNFHPNYEENVSVKISSIEKIYNEFIHNKLSRWECLYIFSFIESYLLLWDEDSELIDYISDKILIMENEG